MQESVYAQNKLLQEDLERIEYLRGNSLKTLAPKEKRKILKVIQKHPECKDDIWKSLGRTEEDKEFAMLELLFGINADRPRSSLTREEKERIAWNLVNNLDKQDKIWESVGLKDLR